MNTRKHKFNAVPKVLDGIKFQSTKEANRYRELTLLQKAGHINALELQVVYPLYVTNLEGGEITQVAVYKADFSYVDLKTGEIIIEDVKGFRTPVYVLKRKLVEAIHGVTIREV